MEIVTEISDSELLAAAQKDLFGEPVLPPSQKQIPHRNSAIRRERFVREYVLNGRNATEAAYRAGYGNGNRRLCTVYGSELLTFPDVQAALAHYTGELRAADLIRADELVEMARNTYDEMVSAGAGHLRYREPIISLLARMGGHLDSNRIEVNNVLNVRDLVSEAENE